MADRRASGRKALRPKTSRCARDLSLYDDQECIGRIKVAGDGKATAFDVHGRLGSFPTEKAALAALNSPLDEATVMKSGHRHSPEVRRRIAGATRAAMAAPAIRQRVSEGIKGGMGTLPELMRLRDAWRLARPSVRRTFVAEVLEPLFEPAETP
jgi:hypothetical protein